MNEQDSMGETRTISRERVVQHNEYLLTGTVFLLQDTQTYESGFQFRNLILTTDDFQPQYITIQFLRGDVSLLDDLVNGDKVRVTFDLRGRPWEDKYFTNVVGENVEVLEAAPRPPENLEQKEPGEGQEESPDQLPNNWDEPTTDDDSTTDQQPTDDDSNTDDDQPTDKEEVPF